VRPRRHATSTTGSRPGFLGKLLELADGDPRAGHYFRQHRQFAAGDRNNAPKDEQELAVRDFLNSTGIYASNPY